jgi:hypothetical protein
MIVAKGPFSIALLLLCVANLAQGNYFHQSRYEKPSDSDNGDSDSGAGGTIEGARESKINGVDFNSWMSGRDSATNQSYFRSGSVYDSEVSGVVK